MNSIPSDWLDREYLLSSLARVLVADDSSMQSASIGSLMIATTSCGNLTIDSTSIFDRPVINPDGLEHAADQEVAVQAYRRTRKAWQYVDACIGREVSPGAKVTRDADLLADIKKSIGPIHPTGSSYEMGRANAAMAVVDSRGRVFGVQDLMVIDSSGPWFTPPGALKQAICTLTKKLIEYVIMGR